MTFRQGSIYQIDISFDEDYMYGKILSNSESNVDYKIVNGNLKYVVIVNPKLSHIINLKMSHLSMC